MSVNKSKTDSPESINRFATLIGYFRNYRGYLVIGLISILLANCLLLSTPYVIKVIFDRLEAKAPSSEILNLVLLILGLTLLAGVFRFLVRRSVIWMSRHIEYDLRRDLFDHLLKLSPSYYHQTRTGDIMARLTNDLEAVRMMVGPGIMHVANTVITLVVAFTLMATLSPTLTLYTLVPMLLFPLAVNKIGNIVHRRFIRIQEYFSTLTAAVQENLSGVRVVKAYQQEQAEIEHFNGMSKKFVDLNMDLARVYSVFFPSMMALASILSLLVLYLGGIDVLEGRMPLSTLVAFFAYLSMLQWPMFALGWVVSLYQRGTASLDRINQVMHTKPDVCDDSVTLHTGSMKGDISIRNLSFAYNGRPVFDSLNLEIAAGESVGVVGLTASGKTTLVSLLARLYPVKRGMIAIDGVDINDWELSALRKQLGFATQEPFLFSDTIENNIRFGRTDLDRSAVMEAAHTAALSADLETFPDGLQTLVGERGITLSGGQKQRTAIARAIVIDPAILILDDVTSAVDTQTEDLINQRIKKVLKGRTAIIISHRISSVKEADRIVYLHDGKIVESGSHNELISIGGRYAELYRSQLMAQELEQL